MDQFIFANADYRRIALSADKNWADEIDVMGIEAVVACSDKNQIEADSHAVIGEQRAVTNIKHTDLV
jgi:hypothetical protein